MNDFPSCIVRPSLNYDTFITIALGGWNDYNIINRIKHNKPIIIHDNDNDKALFSIVHAKEFAIGLLGNPKTIGDVFSSH